MNGVKNAGGSGSMKKMAAGAESRRRKELKVVLVGSLNIPNKNKRYLIDILIL